MNIRNKTHQLSLYLHILITVWVDQLQCFFNTFVDFLEKILLMCHICLNELF
jgi:hypothetical protein